MNIIELENLPVTPIRGKQDFFSEEKIKKTSHRVITLDVIKSSHHKAYLIYFLILIASSVLTKDFVCVLKRDEKIISQFLSD